MRPAPTLPSVLDEDWVAPRPSDTGFSPAVAAAPAVQSTPAVPPPPIEMDPAIRSWQRQVEQLSLVHQQFVDQQARIHQRFLAVNAIPFTEAGQ